MSFWVYENWTAESKAVIHTGECSFCNKGAGVQKVKTDGRNGRWHGPFGIYQEAARAAGRLGRNVRRCRFCDPA